MMKSENTFSPYLKRVDELIRPRHPLLQDGDEIYFLREYVSGAKVEHSPSNQLIWNYKKDLKHRGKPDWPYKEQAITDVANLFRNSIFNDIDLCERVKQASLVPIPPSKAKNSPEYDDRNHRMLKMFAPTGDIRELILQKESRASLHTTKDQPRSHEELLNNYYLDDGLLMPKPIEIWLFDDTLVKGTHFRAAKELLKKNFPNVPVIGFFIARGISLTKNY